MNKILICLAVVIISAGCMSTAKQHRNPIAFYFAQGYECQVKGDYDKALECYTKAIVISPNNGCAFNNLAWIQATCPIARYRDGKMAVVNGLRGCELVRHKNSEHHAKHLDTLAVAYAETGKFKDAIKTITRAIKFAPANELDEFIAHLELFKENKPYRTGGIAAAENGRSRQ